LARILKTTLSTVPANVPYLFAEDRRIDHWRQQLSGKGRFKIGVAWQGNPHREKNLGRSVLLERFAPLAALPGVQLFSLQQGPGSEQLKAGAGRFPIIDLGPHLDADGAFLDTAAVMKNLDLVITSDTSVPHLAGGLSVPVWMALRWLPEWRWLMGREDSP